MAIVVVRVVVTVRVLLLLESQRLVGVVLSKRRKHESLLRRCLALVHLRFAHAVMFLLEGMLRLLVMLLLLLLVGRSLLLFWLCP